MRAKVIKRVVASILALLIFAVYMPVNAIGKEQGVDVFFVLDNSGSMIYNDRHNLRFDVVKKFLNMLDLGDSIGLLNFNTDTELQLPISEIKSHEDKALLGDQIKVNHSSKDTDVLAALSAAFDNMDSREPSKNTKYFILLTDGVIDPGPEFRASKEVREKYYEQLDLLIGEYQANIWPIFVVFLNPRGLEDDYLKTIAQKTGGNFYNLGNANQFEGIFGQIFDEIEIIKDEISEAIEAKIQAEETLIPEEGSDVDMEIDILSPGLGKYYVNEKLNVEAQLFHGHGTPINDQTAILDSFILKILDSNKSVVLQKDLNDEGDNGDVKEGDGIYSISFIPEKDGLYIFNFRAEGHYNEKSFVSEGRVQREILSPGIINMEVVDMVPDVQEVMQGKELKINIDFTGDIDTKHIIEFTPSTKSGIAIKPIRAAIFPLDTQSKSIVLNIPIPRNTSVGKDSILLKADIFSQGVKLEPKELAIDIQVLPYQFLVSNELAIYITLVLVAMGFLVCIYLIYIRLRQKGAWMVKGRIICYRDGEKIQEINLSKARKQRIKIGSRMRWEPHILMDIAEPLLFEIYTEVDALRTFSRLRANYRARYFVETALWDTAIEVKNGDGFTLGHYNLVYQNGKRIPMDMGRDVLQRFDI